MGAGKNKKHATYSVSPTTKAKHHPAAPATAATASGTTSAAPVPQPSSSEPAGAPSPGTAAGVAGAPAQQVAAVAGTEDHAQAADSGLTGPTWPHELPVTAKEEELSAEGPEAAGETPQLAAGVDASEDLGQGPAPLRAKEPTSPQGLPKSTGLTPLTLSLRRRRRARSWGHPCSSAVQTWRAPRLPFAPTLARPAQEKCSWPPSTKTPRPSS